MIALHSLTLHRLQLKARMPFRYGIATMTEVPHVIVRATWDIDGKGVEGVAADHLPPKWFTKDPNRPLDEEIVEMLAVIRAAVGAARGIKAATPFAFWRELYAAQGKWAATQKLPPLLAHFGTSLVERSLIDAFCRTNATTFAAALRENRFGVKLDAIHPSLAGSQPREWLPAQPPAHAIARHTVGLLDPLEATDIPEGERVADGLPQSLGECIRFYGLRHFKIKIDADRSKARARLLGIYAVLARECREGFAFSLDGNESFRDAAAFAAHARELMADPELRNFWPHLLFIEQPLHRDVALTPAADWTRVWPDRPAIIIDESDGDCESLPRALALGYAGTSHKNCKGIFKGVANACLLAQRRRQGGQGMLSGEDLTNVGPVALLQDLAVQAVLGVTSIERNGHHYFAGLAQFPPAIQAHMLRHHADLYVRSTAGWPRLDVRNGEMQLGSVLNAPFGCAPALDLSAIPEFPL